MGVGSTPIRLARQQIWREICDANILEFQTYFGELFGQLPSLDAI